MGLSLQSIRVGIVGLGKIARDEHVPALQGHSAFELVACTSAKPVPAGIASYAELVDMLEHRRDIDAVAICTPPQAHFEAARLALSHGKHVLMEKPPCPTVAAFDELTALAAAANCTLFQTWHARESAGVEAAAAWLAERPIRRGRVVWKEDVRLWHPGQAWIWQEGGFGVLDAGINAISILTRIVPSAVMLDSAHLLVPANCASPIAAAVAFRTADGAMIDAEFDFRHTGSHIRAMEFETDDGMLKLAWPGSGLDGEGVLIELGSQREEYAVLYDRFARLIAERRSETDKRPLELVVEILNAAGRSTVAPFLD